MKSKKITIGLLVIYFITLTWIILFKMQVDSSIFNTPHRSINLIPFAGSLIINGHVDVSEIILNIIVFIPFGVYISMLYKNQSIFKRILPIAVVSLFFEVTQFILGIGSSDITDFIGNTFGGIIGILLFKFIHIILKKKTCIVINTLALIGTILVVLFLGLITIANL